MTKKDYVLIARMFALNEPVESFPAGRALWHGMRLSMADVLARENPKFNRDKFLTACEFANLKRV